MPPQSISHAPPLSQVTKLAQAALPPQRIVQSAPEVHCTDGQDWSALQVMLHELSASHVTDCWHEPATFDPQLTLQLPVSELQDTLPRQTLSLSQSISQLPELHVTAFAQVSSAPQSMLHAPSPNVTHDTKPPQAPGSRHSMSQSPSLTSQLTSPRQLPSPQSISHSPALLAGAQITSPAQLVLSHSSEQVPALQSAPARQESAPMQSISHRGASPLQLTPSGQLPSPRHVSCPEPNTRRGKRCRLGTRPLLGCTRRSRRCT